MKRTLLTLLNILALTIVMGCDDSEDPATASQSSLAPPTGLATVTGDTQIELRFMGNNYEDDFVGYHVLMTQNNIAGLKSTANPGYPVGIDIAKKQGLPRCASNNAFFTAFGVQATTDEDCESDIATDDGTVTDDETDTEDTEDAEDTETSDEAPGVQAAKVMCYDPDSPTSPLGTEVTTSLDINTASDYADGVGVQRCLITGLTNSTTYSFIVVAVTGDEFDEISWTSNVVEDTPATQVFSDTITIPTATYATIELSATAPTTAATKVDGASSPACSDNICILTGTNNKADAKIFLGRDSKSGSYKQRVFVSAGSASPIEIAYRGPITTDPVKAGTVATSVPGDEALDPATSSSVYVKGQKFVVYDNQVYDIEYTLGTQVYYGKLIIDALSYASTPDAADLRNNDVSFKATVLIQGQAGQIHYLRHGLKVGQML